MFERLINPGKGRLDGGTFLLYAPPGEGKSYVATAIALDAMKGGQRVFSNYPIISTDGKYVSRYFHKTMLKKNLNGAMIIIDEAYLDFNSREYKDFSRETHHFFATTGHNEIICYLITQNPQRIDLVIREVCHLFLYVQKTTYPFFRRPVWFTVDAFLSPEEISMSKYGKIDSYYSERFWFMKKVADSYDTKFYAKKTEEPFEGIDWITYNEKNGLYFRYPISLMDKIKNKLLIIKWTIKLTTKEVIYEKIRNVVTKRNRK